MPVTVVVGGQFGSEGKGKVARAIALEQRASIVVRVGGPNSGHTVVTPNGSAMVFRQLPTGATLRSVRCFLPAGSYIVPDVLLSEIKAARLDHSRLVIDPNAVVVTKKQAGAERAAGLRDSIGSTLTGTGAAVVDRALRSGEVRFAIDEPSLKKFVAPVTPRLREAIDKGARIVLEGTQGFGLSLMHTPHYPFATSRDTSASGFLSEAGLSPLDVDDVVMVIRAFPIRVAGNSGPLPREISWSELSAESGGSQQLVERTSVTGKIRRVARFDPGIVRQAIAVNAPTRIVLNHLDYVDPECARINAPTHTAMKFVRWVSSSVGKPIDYVGFDRVGIIAVKRRTELRVAN